MDTSSKTLINIQWKNEYSLMIPQQILPCPVIAISVLIKKKPVGPSVCIPWLGVTRLKIEKAQNLAAADRQLLVQLVRLVNLYISALPDADNHTGR